MRMNRDGINRRYDATRARLIFPAHSAHPSINACNRNRCGVFRRRQRVPQRQAEYLELADGDRERRSVHLRVLRLEAVRRTGLQVVYVVLNAYGWYHWLYGGKNRTELPVTTHPARLGQFCWARIDGDVADLGTLLDAHHGCRPSLPRLGAQQHQPRRPMDDDTKAAGELAGLDNGRRRLHRHVHATSRCTVTAVLYFIFLVLLSIMGSPCNGRRTLRAGACDPRSRLTHQIPASRPQGEHRERPPPPNLARRASAPAGSSPSSAGSRVEVWSVSAVPTACGGTHSVTSAQNCALSATTKNPHTSASGASSQSERRRRSRRRAQHTPLAASADRDEPLAAAAVGGQSAPHAAQRRRRRWRRRRQRDDRRPADTGVGSRAAAGGEERRHPGPEGVQLPHVAQVAAGGEPPVPLAHDVATRPHENGRGGNGYGPSR